MTVAELIKELEKIENKEMIVYMYIDDYLETSAIIIDNEDVIIE